METSGFTSDLGGPAGEHAEQVYLVAQGEGAAPVYDAVSASWRRCANAYGVDPTTSTAPHVLTGAEVNDFRQPLEQVIDAAREELDGLYDVVRKAGYAVLFCDAAGIAVAHRGEEIEASQFKYWRTWLGGVWSEELEGTNGIGTCIIEERPITVHRSQHFRSRHTSLSCSGAPVFDVSGKLMAVLDVSAIDPRLSEGAHALTGALTVSAARAIEERFFREHFRREWIVALALPDDEEWALLLAVDGDRKVVGANHAARTRFLLDDRVLGKGLGLWRLFKRDDLLFRRNGDGDVQARLVVAESTQTCPALITPPESVFGAWRNTAATALHTRPRLDLLRTLRASPTPPRVHGGISPSAMRRVCDYIETHLSESTGLTSLAAIAGLSMFHFAREFKRSTGLTAHHYLIKKRVERAQAMLAQTDLSLSEIALAVGFADQSHLTRHFRRILGTTPGEFRWFQR